MRTREPTPVRSTLLCVTVAAAGAVASAQAPARPAAPRLAFEVASIKPSPPEARGTGTGWGTRPGGRWFMRNMAVSVMLRDAYPAQARDLIGAPAWVTADPYDVETRAAGNPTRDQVRLMLQTLLRERFNAPLQVLAIDRIERPSEN